MAAPMTGGLETTLALLAETKNEAATGLLLAALRSPRSEIKLGALRAVARRRCPTAQRELLQRWHTFSERWKSIVAENTGRISGAIRDAILGTDRQLAANGCDALLRMREYDLIPTLVTAAEDQANPHANLSAETLLSLAEMLYDELAAPRDYRNRRDPQLVRKFVVGSLEGSMTRFDLHQRREILEAFLLLVGCQNSALKGILQNVHAKAYLSTVHLLNHSPRPGVIRLLLNFLETPQTPTTIRAILSRRRDVPFLRQLLRKIDGELPANVRVNLKRIDAFSWLRDDLSILLALNGKEQAAVVKLVMASGMNRLKVFRVIRFVLVEGALEGRRAASAILHQFSGADAKDLMLASLDDEDPQIQANVLCRLREYGVPGAMQRLIEALDSPHEEVREAARSSLDEFTFERFLAAFETLDPAVQRTSGRLVTRVDPTAVEQLRDEFRTPSRNRRLRAVHVALALGVVPEVEPELIQMTTDRDFIVRGEAVRALACCDSPATRQALRKLLNDRTASVQESAERALQAFSEKDAAAAGAPSPAAGAPGQDFAAPALPLTPPELPR